MTRKWMAWMVAGLLSLGVTLAQPRDGRGRMGNGQGQMLRDGSGGGMRQGKAGGRQRAPRGRQGQCDGTGPRSGKCATCGTR